MSQIQNEHRNAQETPYELLCRNLIQTHNWLVNRLQKVFKSNGLTMQQYNILRIIKNQQPEPCNIQLLKDQMPDKQSDVSRLITRLETKGLVQRVLSNSDRRKMEVLLTKNGNTSLDQTEIELEGYRTFLSHLDPGDIEQMNSLLEKMRIV